MKHDPETEEAVKMFGMYFYVPCLFVCVCAATEVLAFCACTRRLASVCVGSCVKATREWMTIGGQCLTAAE